MGKSIKLSSTNLISNPITKNQLKQPLPKGLYAPACAQRDFKWNFEASSWLNLNCTRYLVNIAFSPAVCPVSKGQCLDFDLGGICSCCLMYDLNLSHPFVLLELQ